MPKLRTVDELQAMALDHAKTMMIGERDQLTPTWWIQFDNGPGEMLITPWSDEAEKLAVVELIRDKLKNPHARNYAFLSEVWVATENLKRPTRLTPEQRPDRREAVMVHAFSRSGKGGVKVYGVERDSLGAVAILTEDKQANRFQGRMFDLFRDERAQHAVVRRHKPIAKDRAKITRTPLNHCFDCHAPISAGAPTPDFPDASTPRPGDVAICLHCAHIMAYGDDLTVRALTDAEMIEIAGDADIVRAVNAIVALNKREYEHG
jgi:hypothetical protein